MQNGNVNGSSPAAAPGQQTIQLNPVQAAAFALQFLPRAPHTHGEREAYDTATMFLQAICNGQVIVAPAPQPLPVAAPPAAEITELQ